MPGFIAKAGHLHSLCLVCQARHSVCMLALAQDLHIFLLCWPQSSSLLPGAARDNVLAAGLAYSWPCEWG
eukprot:6490946-Amphidinium_carterae.1